MTERKKALIKNGSIDEEHIYHHHHHHHHRQTDRQTDEAINHYLQIPPVMNKENESNVRSAIHPSHLHSKETLPRPVLCTAVYRRCSLVWNHVANGRPVFSEELLLLACKVWRILSINDSNAKCIDRAKSKALDHNGQGHYLHDIKRAAM